MNLQRIHLKIWSKIICLALRYFFAVSSKSYWRKSNIKGRYFSKRNVVPIVGFGFSQIWKKSVMAARSAVTTVLKKAVPTVKKKL